MPFSIPLCEIDRDEFVVSAWSSGAEWLTGRREAQVVGRSCWDVFEPRDHSGTPVDSATSETICHTLPLEPGEERIVRVGMSGSYVDLNVRAMASQDKPMDVLLLLLAPDGEHASSAPTPTLTPRQLDILRRLDQGESTKEIALALHLSVHTVRHHIHAILSRLGSPTRLSALHRARVTGLL